MKHVGGGEPAGPVGGGQRALQGCNDRSGKSKQEQQQEEGPRLERMWGVKSLMIPVVLGAFGDLTPPQCWVSARNRTLPEPLIEDPSIYFILISFIKDLHNIGLN